MLKVLVVLLVVAFVVILAATLTGTAVPTNPVQLGTHQGPEKGALQLSPW